MQTLICKCDYVFVENKEVNINEQKATHTEVVRVDSS